MRRSASQVARAMSLRDIDAQEDVSFTVREPTDEDQGPDFHYAVVPDEPLMAGRRYRFRSAERDELPPGCDGSRSDWSEASTVEFAVHPAPRMLKTWIGDPMLDPLPEHGEPANLQRHVFGSCRDRRGIASPSVSGGRCLGSGADPLLRRVSPLLRGLYWCEVGCERPQSGT